MMGLNVQQLILLASAAGFQGDDLKTIVAIALAESSGNPTARGDTKLQNATWGPSVGLFQIRTKKSETGKGTIRDINWLLADPMNQAKAAFALYQARKARGHRPFQDWTTYTRNTPSGARNSYTKHMPVVSQQLAALGGEQKVKAIVYATLSTGRPLVPLTTTRTNRPPAGPALPSPSTLKPGEIDWNALTQLHNLKLTPDQIRELGKLSPEAFEQAALPTGYGSGNASVGYGGTMNMVTGGVEPEPLRRGASEAEIQEYFKKYYGAYSWMLDIPDLRGVLLKAATGEIDDTMLDAELRGTKWWREHTPTMQAWEEEARRYPLVAEQKVEAKAIQIELELKRMGTNIPHDRARHLAWTFLRLGLDEQQVKQALAKEIDWKPTAPGSVSATIGGIKAKAADWMVTIDDSTASQWVQKMFTGEMDETGVDETLKQWAKSRFPHLNEYIDRGVTLAEFFEPYKQDIAQTLEINPGTINLLDPKYSSVVEFVDSNGKRRPMTRSETVGFLRKLPEWRGTNQARSQAASIASSFGKLFGTRV